MTRLNIRVNRLRYPNDAKERRNNSRRNPKTLTTNKDRKLSEASSTSKKFE